MHSKAIVASALLGIASAANFDVQVGKGGLTYTPATISAQKGDTVTFIFNGNHDVVQADFATPCQAKNGGIFSTVQRTGSYVVTVQDTNPIWFYCSVASHCQSGMVGVINAPTGKTQSAFAAAAKNAPQSNAPNSQQPIGGTLGTGSGGNSSSSSGGAGAGGAGSSSAGSGSATGTLSSGSFGSSTATGSTSTATGNSAARGAVPAALAIFAGAAAMI